MRLLFFTLILSLFAHASIIKDVYVLQSDNRDLTLSQLEKSNDFKQTALPYANKTNQDIYFKIVLDTKSTFSQNQVLEFDNKFNDIEFNKRFNELEFLSDINYDEFYLIKYLTLEKQNQLKEFYFKLRNESGMIHFDIKTYDQRSYEKNNQLLDKFFGVAYGIIFSAFLFYFAFYIFNLEKTYLYYSLTQASILLILLISSYKETIESEILLEVSLLGFLLFSNLFTRYFLNTQNNAAVFDKILKYIFIYFIIEFILSNFFDLADSTLNIPTSWFLFVYLLCACVVFQKGHKEALFYIVGWGVLIFSIFVIDYQSRFLSFGAIYPLSLIHLTTPLESLILAFALSYKMKLLISERQQQKEYLMQQNKLASMGEMLSNIAHQWRQPLTHLSFILMNLEGRFSQNKLSKEYFYKKFDEANQQLDFMSNTIESFKNFFKSDKQKNQISLVQTIDEVIALVQDNFSMHGIAIEFNYEKDVLVYSYRAELIQVLMNLLNNSKDEFLKKEIQNPLIQINLQEKKGDSIITISDNAGGISDKILDKIFEPYFTTKEEGLGIGLYMSNMIVEKSLKGELSVQNTQFGVSFQIKISN